MNRVLPAPLYTLGNVRLDVERHVLEGPRGTITLCPQLYRLAERLLRRSGAIVPMGDLIAAMWTDPDEEPESVDVRLRQRVQQLRTSLTVISSERVRVRTERGIGYGVEVVR